MPKKGFSLIEALVTITLISLVSVLLLRNFSFSRIDMNQIALRVAGDIRLAQSYALTSRKLSGTYRCGYGFTSNPNASRLYHIYAGRENRRNTNCDASTNYNSSNTTPSIQDTYLDTRVAFQGSPPFRDVFFMSPDARVYINNSLARNPQLITIAKNGENCSSSGACSYICVFPSGKIEVLTNPNLCI